MASTTTTQTAPTSPIRRVVRKAFTKLSRPFTKSSKAGENAGPVKQQKQAAQPLSVEELVHIALSRPGRYNYYTSSPSSETLSSLESSEPSSPSSSHYIEPSVPVCRLPAPSSASWLSQQLHAVAAPTPAPAPLSCDPLLMLANKLRSPLTFAELDALHMGYSDGIELSYRDSEDEDGCPVMWHWEDVMLDEEYTIKEVESGQAIIPRIN